MNRRTVGSRVLLVLGTLLTILAILALWIRGQIIDGQRYVATSTEILAQPAVQKATAAYLSDTITTAPGVQEALRERLPAPVQGLSGPLVGVVGDAAERGALRALSSGAFQKLWRESNALTHREVAAIVNNDKNGGAVVLDLRPMLGRLATRLGFGGRVIETLPPDRGIIRVLSADDVKGLRTGVKALKAGTYVLVVLAILCLVAGAWLAPTRAGGVLGAGAALLVGGVLVLVLRRVVGNQVIADLTADGSIAQAGQATWWVLTAYLADVAGAAAFLGLLLFAGGWMAGSTAAAERIRGPLARGTAAQPAIAYLVAFLVAAGLLMSGLLPWSRSPTAAAAYLLVAVLVVRILRDAGEPEPEPAAT